MNTQRPKVGLVLPGGGARGSYQAGVMKAVAELWPRDSVQPFPVITGTSAGAINAVVLANTAQDFHAGVEDLLGVWANFRCEQVFRSDARFMLKQSLHWFAAFALGGLGPRNPHFLLDNAPLRKLLGQHVKFANIRRAINAGVLDAVAVTASGYDRARAVTFYEGKPDRHPPWERARREGRHERLDLDHLMASVAVPFVFPPVWAAGEFFGDGALREGAPLSPAIHLGADRLLVVGVRDEQSPMTQAVDAATEPPSFGRIAGYLLDTVFLDGLFADLERLARMNRLVEQASEPLIRMGGAPFRRIEMHIIVPSQDVREIAERHATAFPRPVKALLRGVGAFGKGGQQLLSYLLFEQPYTQELIELGYRDCLAQADALRAFLGGDDVPALTAPAHLRGQLDLR